MTAWRVTFPEPSIRSVDILTGKPSLLAVWAQPGYVAFHDLRNGTRVSERKFPPAPWDDRSSDAWRAFSASLTAPNHAFLPIARLPDVTIRTTLDGRMRLIQPDSANLFLEVEGRDARLETEPGTIFAAVGFDRQLGIVAALDMTGRLHIYQQTIRLGIHNVGLPVSDDSRPSVAIAQGGTSIFVTNGERLILTDPGGRVRKQLALHYPAGAIACSPDGRLLAIADIDVGVIRIYNGASFTPTHQKFASDLLSEARRVSASTSALSDSASLGPIAIGNKGVLAFAMSGGIVCVTAAKRLGAVPRV